MDRQSRLNRFWEKYQRLFLGVLLRNLFHRDEAFDLLGDLYLKIAKWDIAEDAFEGMCGYVCNTLIPLVIAANSRKIARRNSMEAHIEDTIPRNLAGAGVPEDFDFENVYGSVETDITEVYTVPIYDWLKTNAPELYLNQQGHSIPELARAFGVSTATLKSRMHRQKKKLASEFQLEDHLRTYESKKGPHGED